LRTSDGTLAQAVARSCHAAAVGPARLAAHAFTNSCAAVCGRLVASADAGGRGCAASVRVPCGRYVLSRALEDSRTRRRSVLRGSPGPVPYGRLGHGRAYGVRSGGGRAVPPGSWDQDRAASAPSVMRHGGYADRQRATGESSALLAVGVPKLLRGITTVALGRAVRAVRSVVEERPVRGLGAATQA
jgi:hypothetical protein